MCLACSGSSVYSSTPALPASSASSCTLAKDTGNLITLVQSNQLNQIGTRLTTRHKLYVITRSPHVHPIGTKSFHSYIES
jgi:hypothetical protein